MRNLLDDRRLQRWCDSFGADTFVMTDKGFAVPSLEFNRIFILTHIYRHFLFEGIGLRQLMDYYFVLRARDNNLNIDLNLNNKVTTTGTTDERSKCRGELAQTMPCKEEEDRRSTEDNFNLDLNLNNKLLRKLRMKRFAAAVMWVLGHVFGLEREYMLCEPDEKEGRFILDEIMQTGNFGQGDRRYKGYGKLRRMSRHGLHLLMHYPSEVIWTPVWLVYHKVWRYRKLKRHNI